MKNFLLTCALLGASIPAFAAGNVITYVNCDANSFQNFTNNYTNDWKLKNSADQYWTVKNFNNNNGGWEDFIRTGWRTAAIVGSVTTDFMIAEQVGEIVVDVWQCKTGLNDKLNKASIYVADNLDFENAAEYDFTDKVTTDEFEQAVSVKITAPKANQYYMVAFDCGKASNNGFIQLAGITYYEHEGGEVPALKPAGLSYDWTEYEAVLGEDFVAPTLNNPNNLSVVYSSSNTDVATVDVNTGKVTLVNAGLVTITATSAATDEFEAGEASYVIAVQGKSDTDGVLFSFNPLKENQIESVNSYSDVWTVKDGDLEWTVAYFNNNKNGWDFVRAGNKNVDYVPFIETDFASNGTVASLEIDMEIRSGGTPTKATVYTSSTDDYTNAVSVDFT